MYICWSFNSVALRHFDNVPSQGYSDPVDTFLRVQAAGYKRYEITINRSVIIDMD